MNTTNHEISSKKEQQLPEQKLTLSPFISLEGSGIKLSASPLFEALTNNKSRPQIRHDARFSPFTSPNNENKLQWNTPSEAKLRPSLLSLVSPFESAFRKESCDDKLVQSTTFRPKIQSPQFGESSISDPSSFISRIYVPPTISPQDIESLRREITSKGEGSEKSTEVTASKKPKRQARPLKEQRIKRAAPEPMSSFSKKKEKPFPCKYCKMSFSKAQALGGHMSRRHPGKSNEYNYKKTIRKMREIERVKLHLAKKKYFSTLNYDYDDLLKTVEGKMRARNLMNRTRIKRIKRELTEKEVNNFIDTKGLEAAQ